MSKKRIYYSVKRLLEKEPDANIYLIISGRSDGKSYSVKHDVALSDFFNFGERFMLVRRLKEEINGGSVEQYFSDVDFKRFTEKYNCVTKYRSNLYLSNFDIETCTTTKGEKIGYAVALSTEQNFAGGSFLDVHNIVFEEFMSRTVYLANEPSKLMNLYCTVDRKRGTTKLFLLGNTITRVCPYLEEWGLQETISKMKQGDIATVMVDSNTQDEDGNEIYIKVAIDYPKSYGSSYTIGKHNSMLSKGAWQTDPQPKLPKSKKCYKVLYRFGFQYQSFRFLCELLVDKEDASVVCWFIYPHYTDFSDDIIVFSDLIKSSRLWQRNIYDVTINERLRKLFQTFKENMIFYSSDLCGTDFKQVKDFEIRR